MSENSNSSGSWASETESKGSMTSLAVEVERLKHDKRLLELNMSRGKISKAEVQKYLEALPDSSDNVARIDLENEGLN